MANVHTSDGCVTAHNITALRDASMNAFFFFFSTLDYGILGYSVAGTKVDSVVPPYNNKNEILL